MYGLDWNDPLRIRSWQELVSRDRIFKQVRRLYPGAAGEQIARLLN